MCGRQNAVKRTLAAMEEHAAGGTRCSGKCWICHSDCPDVAEKTRRAVKKSFPKISGEIKICDIGAIIALHCGIGTVAVFFFGNECAPYHKQ